MATTRDTTRHLRMAGWADGGYTCNTGLNIGGVLPHIVCGASAHVTPHTSHVTSSFTLGSLDYVNPPTTKTVMVVVCCFKAADDGCRDTPVVDSTNGQA